MNTKAPKQDLVHFVLSYSYSVYLFSIIAGLILDFFYPVRFSSSFYSNVGLVAMIAGTALIYWAQKTSSCLKEKIKDNNTHHTFASGPYKFTRNPTHTGLMFLTLGFGLILGSFFVTMITLVAFILTKFVFLPKEEKLLEEKYGESYCQYKKKVNTWL